MKKQNKNFLFRAIFYLSLLIIIFACSEKLDKYEDCTDSDYDNCNTEVPVVGSVTVNITINEFNDSVIVVIKEGKFESGQLVLKDTLYQNSKTYSLDLNKNYSAAAYYKSGSDTIIAIDGGKLDYYSYKACELTCYEVRNLTLDLRL